MPNSAFTEPAWQFSRNLQVKKQLVAVKTGHCKLQYRLHHLPVNAVHSEKFPGCGEMGLPLEEYFSFSSRIEFRSLGYERISFFIREADSRERKREG